MRLRAAGSLRNSFLFSLLMFLIIFSLAFTVGCGHTKIAGKVQKNTVTIVDADGQRVEVKYPLERILVIGAAQMHAVCALGAEDKMVGVSEFEGIPDLEEKLKEKTVVGKWSAPSFEKILELKPETVITYGRSVKGVGEMKDKLEPAGVQVLSLDFCRVEYLDQAMKDLGIILGKEERVEEFLRLFEQPLKTIRERTATLKPEQRAEVYWEQYKPNRVAGLDSQGDQMIRMAGGINIAKHEGAKEVSAEWVPAQKPQVIVKNTAQPNWGYGVTESAVFRPVREEITQRPGFDQTPAVKNNRVFIITNDLCDPRAYVGVCYLAKWFYPELFKDLNPEALHKTVLEKFYGLKYKGVFVYP